MYTCQVTLRANGVTTDSPANANAWGVNLKRWQSFCHTAWYDSNAYSDTGLIVQGNHLLSKRLLPPGTFSLATVVSMRFTFVRSPSFHCAVLLHDDLSLLFHDGLLVSRHGLLLL